MSLNRTNVNGFQTFVNRHLAPGVVGAFASMNPRAVVPAGPGAFRADSAAPVVVGFFAWATPSDSIAYGVKKSNSFLGFIGNEGQTVITDFLGESRLAVQAGFPVTLYSHGDFWAKIAGGAVTIGATIYADATTGEPTVDSNSGANPDTGFKAMTAVPLDVTSSAASFAAGTGVLTVGGSIVGTIDVGDGNSTYVNGTSVPANVFITGQLTGTPGGAGTYATTYRGAAIGSEAMSFSTGKLAKISRTF